MDPQIADLLKKSVLQERAGNLPETQRLADRVLALAQALNDRDGICGGLQRLALVQWRLGHYAEATELAGRALTFSDHSTESVRAYLCLGACASETNDFDKAEDWLRRGADLSREIGFQEGLLLILHCLGGNVYMPRGQFILALQSEQEAYRIGLQINSQVHFGLALNSAYIYQVMGRRDEAKLALAELSSFTHWRAQAAFFILSARVAMDDDDLDAARDFLRQARPALEDMGTPEMEGWLRHTLSRFYRLREDGATARAWADDALATARRVGYRFMEGESLIERAQSGLVLHDWTAAESDLQKALAVLEPLGAAYLVALSKFLLAALAHQQKRPDAEALWVAAARAIALDGYEFLLERERSLAFPLLAHYARSDQPDLKAATDHLLDRLARVPPQPLHILGLGQFQVRQGRRELERRELERRKGAELFACLLLQPERMATRDVIGETLWPEISPESMQERLHQATSSLRRALEPDLPVKFPSRYLRVDGGHLQLLMPAGSTTDWTEFEEQVERGLSAQDVAALEHGLALYQGELFPSLRYADWTGMARERLAQLELRGLLALAALKLAGELYAEALALCQQLLRREPWQEEAVLVGMRACLGLNDRIGALRLHRALELALREELNASPRQDIAALAIFLRQ